jgi:hypothetical protein
MILAATVAAYLHNRRATDRGNQPMPAEEAVMQGSRIAARVASLACGIGFLLLVPAVLAQAPTDLTKRSTSMNAADHQALAAQYRAHAAEHDADAAAHEALVTDAKTRATDDDAWDLARDAAHYAEHSREAAEALRDLAQLHEAIAERLALPEAATAPDRKADEKGCCAKHKADNTKTAPVPPTHDHPAK